MNIFILPDFTVLNALGAIGIAFVYIFLASWLREPHRQQFNAIVVAGAGAAYLSGGLGIWEFVFCGVMTGVAFKGLQYYPLIGVGWLLHTGWDVVHHLYGNPIIPFAPLSSAGCAVCDAVLALWFFYYAPSIVDWYRRKKVLQRG